MKNKIQFKQQFATTFRPFTRKIMVLVYQSTILVHFAMLAPKRMQTYDHDDRFAYFTMMWDKFSSDVGWLP